MLEFLFLLIPSILSIISPVLTANIISSITVYDFSKAINFLSWDFAIILVSAISYFAYHLVSTKVNRTIVTNLQNYVYQNVKENKNINKISLSVLNDIYSCVNFNKNLLYKVCFLIKAVVILIIIIKYNLYIAFAIIIVSLISFLLLNLTDKKIQKYNLEFSGFQNSSLELFNSIQQGAESEHSQNVSMLLKDKYFTYVNGSIKANNKISLLYNINNNFITLILKATIFASTLYLVGLVKSTTLTLSLYLILTPYLSSSAENLISFLDLFSEFGTIDNALLSFDALKFQSTLKEDEKLELSTYNLYFFNTSTKSDNTNDTQIKNLNLKLDYKTFNIIVGSPDSGKETIFNLLNKKIKPSSGSIFIDDKNIENIPPENYSTLISFTNRNPYFYNISIMENMYLVCQNKTKILKTITDWNLKPLINKLPDKINTLMTDKIEPNLTFVFGLLRCFLSGAKIICVFNVPAELSADEHELLENIFKKLKKECTIILFSNKPIFETLQDNVFLIEKGKIKNKNNKN